MNSSTGRAGFNRGRVGPPSAGSRLNGEPRPTPPWKARISLKGRLRRLAILASLMSALIAAGLVGTGSAFAYSGPIFTVMNTSETLPDGVWFRNSPHTSDTDRVTGHGVYMGERVQEVCYAWGDAVGPYNNGLWYFVLNVTRPVNAGVENSGYLNAHYINDGTVANEIVPGVPQCGVAPPPLPPPPPPPPHVTPCVFNMRWATTSLSFSYSGKHRYYGNAWQAAKNWTDLGTAIKIIPLPTGLTGQVIFDDVNLPRVGWYAQTQIDPSWETINAVIPSSPHNPTTIHIKVNQAYMSSLDDFHRTYALTHEIGHALGLAHTDQCGISDSSIMLSGGAAPAVPNRTINKPQYYDKIDLEELYGLPTG
jgi:hypothetical protein